MEVSSSRHQKHEWEKVDRGSSIKITMWKCHKCGSSVRSSIDPNDDGEFVGVRTDYYYKTYVDSNCEIQMMKKILVT